MEAGKDKVIKAMKQFIMTGTDMKVSEIALGGAGFGTQLSNEEVARQIDTFIDCGGLLLDSAHVYGNWVEGKDSPSEEAIGTWIRATGKRNAVTISTKGGMDFKNGGNVIGLKNEQIQADLEKSLRKFGTDYVDLYFLHRDDPTIPVEEILGFLEEKVKEGKIRYYGCSNWRLPRIKEAQEAARKNGWKGFVNDQVQASLADINVENMDPDNTIADQELRAFHAESQMSMMAYMSMGRGYFPCVCRDIPISDETKSIYGNESNHAIAKRLRELDAQGFDPASVCMQYFDVLGFQAIPIAGFAAEDLIVSTNAGLEKRVPEEILREIAGMKVLQ